MKLKSIPLLPVLMLVLGACGDGSQPLPAVTPTSTQVLLIATPIPTPEVVIKEVPVEDLAKVQILQENVAALKEQVAQGQAANRELEWNYEATTAELMDAIKQAEETTVAPAALFKPSLEERYEVGLEEAVVYGTGGTMDGGHVELLLDLAIPDTGTDGPRPLFIHIHGGGFHEGSRWAQWDVAKRGWVAASIDYRLAGDDPLPGSQVKRFFDAAGGESSSARNRSVVASIEDTLVALDYLLSRADELNIDTDRIVLKGESAGAFIALTVAYCADKFEISGPTIAAVIDFSGGIAETFCGGGTAIDPGEAAVFIVHGTADKTVSFSARALSIVDGAKAAGVTYELHPLEGVGHEWLLGMLGQTTADGRKIDDLMYEFLNRVLYER